MKKIKALFASLSITRRELLLLLSGSAILAFGLYQVHSISGVTEGGVLGLTLLGHHWLGISPSVSSLILNAACYLLGWRLLGREDCRAHIDDFLREGIDCDENGEYTEIELTWNDAAKTLTIGNREGAFDGMQASRRFTVVCDGTKKEITYDGTAVTVTLE